LRTFERTLHELAFDPLIARLVGQLEFDRLAELAEWIEQADPYTEVAKTTRALELASAGRTTTPRPRDHFEHRLWCAWRDATLGCGRAAPLPIRVEGESWLRETEGRPTLIVTPMTVATGDALHAIAELTTGRRCVVYGEEAALYDVGANALVTGDSGGTAATVLSVLREGGALCTYADFVYDGRAACPMPLFGTERPASSGFLSLASRVGTMLLPLVCLRAGGELVVHCEEPVLIEAAPERRHAARTAVASVVGELLEGLISLAPEQWRLLPSLTFEAPQMAVA
jgi:hypothetical protein